MLVWLEYGLSIPKFRPDRDTPNLEIEGEDPLVSVPRNGGEKNFVSMRPASGHTFTDDTKLEYVYRRPRFLTTCVYGLNYLILGNLAGNAIAFGTYLTTAAGVKNNEVAVRLLAVAALTFSCILHGTWRKGGIWTFNTLAVFKVLVLLSVIGIGFALGAGASVGGGPIGRKATSENFGTSQSFADARRNLHDNSSSILLVIYSFSGFDQPFYVSSTSPVSASCPQTDSIIQMLSETSQSKKSFAKTCIGTMIIVSVLFILANVAYVSVQSTYLSMSLEIDQQPAVCDS